MPSAPRRRQQLISNPSATTPASRRTVHASRTRYGNNPGQASASPTNVTAGPDTPLRGPRAQPRGHGGSSRWPSLSAFRLLQLAPHGDRWTAPGEQSAVLGVEKNLRGLLDFLGGSRSHARSWRRSRPWAQSSCPITPCQWRSRRAKTPGPIPPHRSPRQPPAPRRQRCTRGSGPSTK